ncbi:MAG: dTDP-4-dehydrorhamnose 3,5-epimerase, partial [Gammaproteobacteria bacterium]|nr:dTDP-4-dehydrorhamnose 3,5-epimerase [Gammaproteobacteria bacterium]
VPPGFAHGFLVLSEVADLVYKCTDYYYPEHERTIKWDDPNIGVNWPVPADTKLLLSDKDISAIPFKSAEYYQ